VIVAWPERGERCSGHLRGLKYDQRFGRFSIRLVDEDRTTVVRWLQGDFSHADEWMDGVRASLGDVDISVYYD
jgi:hypothetical protein